MRNRSWPTRPSRNVVVVTLVCSFTRSHLRS
jgi:hypothetical protein